MSEFDFHFPGSRAKGILLVHGLTGSPTEMRFVGKALAKQGFSIKATTLAGHCAGEAALLATTYEDWVESIRTALRAFAQEVDEVYVAGICVGGMLGLCAAALEGDLVKGAVIYSPLFNYDGWNTPWYYRLGPFGIPPMMWVPGLRSLAYSEAPPYGIKSERVRKVIMGAGADAIPGTLPHFPVRALYQNCRLNAMMRKALPRITIPTLLIHAREDDVGHPRNALKLQKLHGGHCEIAWLENSYHMIHVDQERGRVATLTGDFFGRQTMKVQAEAA